MAATFEGAIDGPDELDAVNDVLSAIGESPVNTLEGDTNADIANARRILANVNREIQSQAWSFNIEEGVELVPDVFSKLIPYLRDFLRVTSQGGTIYIKRGDYVYDTNAKTDKFENPIQVDLVRLRDYSEMPTCFRTWIIAKASRRFNIRFFGASELEASLAEEEDTAKRLCMEYELDFGEFNMLDGDVFVQGKINR